MTALVVIMMGSKSDHDHANQVKQGLDQFSIPSEMHIASAHKSPARVLELLDAYRQDPRSKVYITIAGRSNALSGMVDAQVSEPVIACPPLSDAFGGADIFSSLRMPSGVAPATVLDPGGAALLAAKILGLLEADVQTAVAALQEANRGRIEDDDNQL